MMRYCVNCGSTAQADDRYCARCGYILRDRPDVSPSPQENTSSQAPEPVYFAPKTHSRSRTRKNGPNAAVLGIVFIMMGLVLGMIILCPWFIGGFATVFSELGGKFGELGGEFGSAFGELGSEFGELGGEFGELGGEFGRTFGGSFGRFGSRFGSTFLRVLLVVGVFACFMIPGLIILLRSRQTNSSQNIRWD
jgi:hypothetical protein